MLKAILLLIATAILPVANDDTVWWQTDGAVVLGSHNSNCSLFVYHTDTGLAFSWTKDHQEIMLVDNSMQFAPSVPMAIQIGDTWLNDPAKLDAQAIGEGSALRITPTQPFESLMAQADHVSIKLQYDQITIALPRTKMAALVEAANKCRTLLR